METSKILIINTSPYVSGAEKSLNMFLNNTIFKNSISLVTGNDNFFNVSKDKLVISLKKFNIFLWLKSFCRTMFFLLKINPKIIYFNTEKSFITFFPIVLFSYNRKIIWHARDNIKRKKIASVLSFFCDTIICNSEYVLNQLKESKKAIVIPNGVNINQFTPSKSFNNEGKVVACISQLTPWKKIEDFIEVARIVIDKCSDVKFLIVGDVLNSKDVKYKKQLQDLVALYNLQSRIIFEGFINNVSALIQGIDVLCHLAIGEPFGRVIIEAMSCGKAVIAYDSGGPKEIITEKTGVLVAVDDVRKFAKELEQLLNDEPKRLILGVEGVKRVKEKYSSEDYTVKLDGILKKHL